MTQYAGKLQVYNFQFALANVRGLFDIVVVLRDRNDRSKVCKTKDFALMSVFICVMMSSEFVEAGIVATKPIKHRFSFPVL